MSHCQFVWLCLGIIACCHGVAWAGPKAKGVKVGEVTYANQDYKLLDTFEAHRLTKADEVFAKGDYKRAISEYDSFVLEFPQSKALAYALLRKARCLHLDNKRFEAIKVYREVLEYFPNVVNYAAPALFFSGQAHWENSDNDKAVAAWAQMAADKEYSRHPLGAVAFNELGDYLMQQNKTEDAARYYQLVAVNFRTVNPAAANYAIEQAVRYFVRVKMDEPALREFYKTVKTFDGNPKAIEGEVEANRDYWNRVMGSVRRYAQFPADQAALKDRYYRSWADAMEGKFTAWDDFQVDIAGLRLESERDVAKWTQRLDKQFSQFQKTGDNTRVMKWMQLFKENKAKVVEYYGKLEFGRMSNAQLIDLLRMAYGDLKDPSMGQSVFNRIPLSQLPDAEKAGLARWLARAAPDLVKPVCLSIQDKELGQFELLTFYAGVRDDKNALPLADALGGSPTYAAKVALIKADLLFTIGRYEKAIPAYQVCDNPPKNLWRIAECYEKLGKLEQAIGQLREVENFFKDYSAEAAIRIASVYHRAGQRVQYIAALRAVMKKYPKSGPSSSAHEELEKLGVQTGGGVDAGE